jgi:hypothetical protein
MTFIILYWTFQLAESLVEENQNVSSLMKIRRFEYTFVGKSAKQ